MRTPRQKPNRSRGATLLEFVVYVGVIGVILIVAATFAAEFVTSQLKALSLTEVVRNARFAASRLEIEVRESSALDAGSSVFGTNPGTLSLTTADSGTNPTVFEVSDGALTVKQGSGAAAPLTNSKVEVEEFVLENLSTNGRTQAVRFHLKIRSKNPDAITAQTAETTVESTVRVRSKDGFSN